MPSPQADSPDPARLALIQRAQGADTFDELAGLRHALADWLTAHPDDDGLRALVERLAVTEMELRRQSGGSFGYLTTGER